MGSPRRRRSLIAAAALLIAAILALLLLLPEVPTAPSSALPDPEPPTAGSPAREETPSPAPPKPAHAEVPAPVPAPVLPIPAARESRTVVLEGTVRGLRDEPLAGATVTLLDGPPANADPRAPLYRNVRNIFQITGASQTTKEDGAFRFTLAARASGGLIAWGGGHANTLLQGLSLREDVRGLVLRMEPAAAVSGRVFRPEPTEISGQPCPAGGAALSLRVPWQGGNWLELAHGEADGDGRFRIWGFAPGAFTLFLESADRRSHAAVPVHLPAEDVEIRLLAKTLVPLDGVVLLPDGNTRAGGARVRVRTLGPLGPAEDEATTDGEGKFRFAGLEVMGEGRPTTLHIEADGGSRGVGARDVPAWFGGTSEWITLQAGPSGILRGRLVDASPGRERPGVAGAAVVLRGAMKDPTGRNSDIAVERVVTTSEDGTFETAGLPDRGVRLSLAPGDGDWDLAEQASVAVPDAGEGRERRVEVEALPRATVEGMVLLPDGGPAEGARVRLHDEDGPPSVVTGADGRFLLQGISILNERFRRTAFVLRASKSGYVEGIASVASLPPGGAGRGIVVTLGPPTRAIAARVLDESGAPMEGVKVTWSGWRGRTIANQVVKTTGPGGWFTLEVGPGLEWIARAEARGFAAASTETLSPGVPVPDLVLRRLPPESPR